MSDDSTVCPGSAPTVNMPLPSATLQQLGILNFRVGDLVTQLNALVKAMSDESSALRQENADLKAQIAELSQQAGSE